MKPTIIMDHNFFCHRAMHVHGELSNRGEHIGVIFGYLQAIKSLATEFQTDSFWFVCDSLQSLRKDEYPTYKEKRSTGKDKKQTLTEEEYKAGRKQFTHIRNKLLPDLGFRNIYIQPGYEGDDHMARLVMQHYVTRKLVMATPDEDHLQLLDFADMWSPVKKELINAESFSAKWHILPAEWAEVKAIAGCSSDEVEGVPGVGAKTAVKYLQGRMNPKTKTYQKIVNSYDIINRNRRLVTLPFPGTKLYKVKEDVLSYDAFCDLCRRYNFTYFLDNRQQSGWWHSFLNKEMF